ncbi:MULTISPECIES: Lrp/AsnC family transcriptional regulator [Anoxynatronum]|uniref:Lrp/AsnC family transcriptional regulator, regulator for asnA, asnC and gidA n=2 Tax=Anoxynatronum TaxID=210622 RepID=A0AA46AIW2_9CLOT|nr:Lrp/AsnC family transcriptional regulator [Anoxynatronum buryatiense]SMP54766.1 Lrp/AsnC family transcriptional regulator, regulator for asnA, asnC and gidA [Anoxynatronum buryatiense]
MKNPYGLDHVDMKIIRMLQRDGRTPNTDIARELGVSESTVRNRISRLIDNKVMQIVAVADPFKLGLDVAAMIKIHSDIKKVDHVAAELGKINEIWYIALATGRSTFDIEVYVKNIHQLHELLEKKIWPIDGIEQTETSVVLSYLKREYCWNF